MLIFVEKLVFFAIFSTSYYYAHGWLDNEGLPVKSQNRLTVPWNIFKHIRQFENDVEKPFNDNRSYRGLILKNNLRILLVSDETAPEAAVSMDVNTGLLNDPREFPGLAHFLEHVVLIRTKNNDSDNLMSYVQNHGGDSNAFTSIEDTVYHFSILPEYLADALRRLAQAFIAPPIVPETLKSEINAVQSEYSLRLKQEFRRLFEVYRAPVHPDHAYRRYFMGNEKSLLGSAQELNLNLTVEMQHFFEKFYSADRTYLAVLGRENLDQLTEMVVPLFAELKDKQLGENRWDEHPLQSPQHSGYVLKYVPLVDIDKLVVYFAMPDFKSYYNDLPAKYIEKFFSNRGPGCLAFSLKSQNLTSYFQIGYAVQAKGFAILEATFVLTKNGLLHVDSILHQFFGYLNYIKTLPIQKWMIDEIGYQRRQQFETQEKRNAVDYCNLLSNSLKFHTLDKVLVGDYEAADTFDEKHFKDALSFLRSDNFNYIVLSNTFSGKTDRVGKWFGADYSIEKIAEETVKSLDKATINQSEIRTPVPNEFLTPWNKTKATNTKSDLSESEKTFPKAVYQDKIKRLWFNPTTAESQKVYANFLFKTPMWRQTVNLDVFTSVLPEKVRETLGPALEAGYAFSSDVHPQGFFVKLSGFREKMPIFVRKCFEIITKNSTDDETFQNIKQLTVSSAEASMYEEAHEVAGRYVTKIGSTQYTIWADLLPSIRALTKDDLQAFQSRIFSRLFIECLIYGSIEQEEAIKLFQEGLAVIEESAHTKPILSAELPAQRAVQLPDNSYHVYEKVLPVQPDTSVYLCFQSEAMNDKNAMTAALLGYILQPICFSQFRTVEQLGYVAGCWSNTMNSVNNFCFDVQGNYSANLISSRIEAFISNVKDIISKLPSDEFLSLKKTFVESYEKKSNTAKDMFDKYWKEISAGEYFFNRRTVYAEILKNITMDDLLRYVQKTLDVKSNLRKKLAVYIHAAGTSDTFQNRSKDFIEDDAHKQPRSIENIDEFVNSMPLYPPSPSHIDSFLK